MGRVLRRGGLGAATAILAAAMALAGCGDDDDGNGTGGGGYGGGPDTGETGQATVAVAETSLGEVLVDGEGMTLYLFTDDTDGTSTCYDECETNWPPLVVDGEATVDSGLDESLVGTTERDDGSTQVTYNNWPLYYWAGDSEPGDVDGQGVGGIWFVLDAEGNAIESSG